MNKRQERGRFLALAITAVSITLVVSPASTSADQLKIVTSTRPSSPGGPPVTIKTLVRAPQFSSLAPAGRAVPRAIIVLLPGGDGWLDIDIADPNNAPPRRLNGNFAVRTRDGLAGQAFLTVLVDGPSDRQNATGMTGGFRASDHHAADLTAIVDYFRPRLIRGRVRIGGVAYGPDAINSPIIVVGSSAGTISAVLSAIRPLPAPTPPVFPVANRYVGGIVLTSSVTTGTTNIDSLPLASIVQPVLFVHHVNDGCMYAKYRNATDAAYRMMKASVRVSFAEIAGTMAAPSDAPSDPTTPVPNPDPCGAPGTTGYHLHGFHGAGTAALDAIQRWISATFKR